MAASAAIGQWLEPYCREHGFVFCPRKHIEWYGARRGNVTSGKLFACPREKTAWQATALPASGRMPGAVVARRPLALETA